MNKIWLIIKREYLVRIRQKSFLIMTILGPLLMAGVILVPIYLSQYSQEEKIIALHDKNTLLAIDDLESDYLHFVRIPKEELQIAKNNLSESPYYAILEVQSNKNFSLYSEQQISLSIKENIETKLQSFVERKQLEASGIDLNILDQVNTAVELKTIVVGEEGETSGSAELSFGIGFMSGILIYMFIFMYGTMVLRGVIEEKNSRIVEIVISSVKPFQLMLGKILGVALVGLTQFLLWIMLTSFFSSVAESLFFSSSTLPMNNMTMQPEQHFVPTILLQSLVGVNILQLVGCFIFYFLGGYLMYSAMFAAVGSAVDTETDTQPFILPITIPLILSFILLQPIMENPNGSLAQWFSLLPLTSPVIMMARIPYGVSNAELLLSMLLLILGFLLTTLLAAKIYRTGILMYGKKVTYRDLWKWLRHH